MLSVRIRVRSGDVLEMRAYDAAVQFQAFLLIKPHRRQWPTSEQDPVQASVLEGQEQAVRVQ